jgi:hypothetical protein
MTSNHHGFTEPSERSEGMGEADYVYAAEGWQPAAPQASGAPGGRGSARKKRRRQRSQHGKRPHMQQARGVSLDVISRERIFQELEGLLRQIREQAEETACWGADQLTEMTQTVTSFTKALEEQSDPLPERARSEYQRIRDKLSQALRG